jgi:membrane protein DedA with SNARE-associated domain
MGMKFKHFLSVDLFSGLIWAPLYSLPGYYGTKLLLQTSYILELIAGLLLISILAIVLFKKFSNKSKN